MVNLGDVRIRWERSMEGWRDHFMEWRGVGGMDRGVEEEGFGGWGSGGGCEVGGGRVLRGGMLWTRSALVTNAYVF